MSVLYLTKHGSTLRKEGQRLVVSLEGDDLLEMPVFRISQVVVMAYAQITTQALSLLMDNGVDVAFFSPRGRYRGRLVSGSSRNALLRRQQYARFANPESRLLISRSFVTAKLSNSRALLLRWNRERRIAEVTAAAEAMGASISQISVCSDVRALCGIEGYTGARYFAGFKRLIPEDFRFSNRNRRPPRDPVNVMLSFGYAMLTNEVMRCLYSLGLDPYAGFLHEDRHGRPSLALDLVEEFRAVIVDALVLSLIGRRTITSDDFVSGEDESCPTTFGDGAKAAFLRAFTQKMNSRVKHPHAQTDMSYAGCISEQARRLVRWISHDEEYNWFSVR